MATTFVAEGREPSGVVSDNARNIKAILTGQLALKPRAWEWENGCALQIPPLRGLNIVAASA